ncbi:hypothetical protein FQ154_01575 [Paeniglutamicibacter gangotriensis]|uniref:Uncharacterized protein n=1 Tax=Paeniglutamicibacter gangotriensis TaxID=254787 RepID=A0A5B0ENZ7_9MICC|nr:hypothetical protein [Paeniglutamicibacter gangotriensis]KAA0979875.1 hypothetical protein FQ154_01575 [Paeniglutamicibacter gangotriensis]
MQSVPGFPTDLTSSEPTAEVRINGVPVDFEDVSVASDIQSAMPSHVAAAGGSVVASTGDVTILPNKDVITAPNHPWNGSTPTQGSKVTVDAGYGDARARVFTGGIDNVSGAPSDPAVSAGLIDAVDKLDQRITIPPLLNAAPSLSDDWTFRRAGLSSIYITDRVLRHCGFYATPRLSGNVVFAAPMMGSTWPERGVLVSAWAHSDPNASAAFRKTPWGMGLGNAVLAYKPEIGSGNGQLDGPFQMVFSRSLHTTMTTSASWSVMWGNNGVRVAMTSDGRVVAQHVVGKVAGPIILTLSASSAASADTFTVRWLPTGNVTIYASNGQTVTTTVALPSGVTSTPMSDIEIFQPPETSVWGGMQASFSTYQHHQFPRTATITQPTKGYGLIATPFFDDVSCADILKAQAEAELAAMWIDEHGVFQWVSRDVLTSTAPVGTLTSTENLLDLPWEVPPKSVFSKVIVESQQANVTRRAKNNLTLWTDSNSSMDNRDESTTFIEPPADEEWGQVDWPPSRAAAAPVGELRWGRGSYMGGVVMEEYQDERWASAVELAQTTSTISPQKWLISSKATITANQAIDLRMREHLDFSTQSGRDLAVVRGKWKNQWEDLATTGTATGPPDAPVLNHPVGAWIQDAGELKEFADWMAAQVTVSAPIIRDVPIIPDTRIQKGDVFWLEDTDVYRVRLKVLVMGLNLTISAGPPVTMDQSITCRIISMERLGMTYEEFNLEGPNVTYQQWQAQGPLPQTYADFNNT